MDLEYKQSATITMERIFNCLNWLDTGALRKAGECIDQRRVIGRQRVMASLWFAIRVPTAVPPPVGPAQSALQIQVDDGVQLGLVVDG